MADYEKMYYQLAGQVAEAIDLLIKAQQQAEERYLSSEEEAAITPADLSSGQQRQDRG